MYIESVPNRNSPPAVLLRESYRDAGKVKKRTLANLTKWPPPSCRACEPCLKGGVAVAQPAEAFDIVRSLPHGHVAAVLGTLRKLRLDRTLAAQHCAQRDRVLALIIARILNPQAKLATARGLAPDTASGLAGRNARPWPVRRGRSLRGHGLVARTPGCH